MKKIILIPLLSICFFMGADIALADDNNTLAIKTNVITDDYKVYAENNLAFYLKGILIAENIETNLNNYELGTPFSLNNSNNTKDTVIFPIIKDGSIVYTFILKKENNQFVVKMSKMLVNELNDLQKNNSSANIALVSADNGDIYYEENGNINLLWKNPESISDNIKTDSNEKLNSKLRANDSEYNDIFEKNTFDINVDPNVKKNSENKMGRSITTDQTGTQINWKITETQGSESWCAAYAAAMILNNKNDARPTKVSDLVKWGKKSKTQGFYNSEIIKYAKTRGVNPVEIPRPTTWNETLTQIKKSNAVYGSWECKPKKTIHAIDIIGTFSENTLMGRRNGYIIWNPWRTYPEIVDAETKQIQYIADSEYTFTWINSITNW